MTWFAIVKTEEGTGRVEKYQAFKTQEQAKKHADEYGGVVIESNATDMGMDYKVVGTALVQDRQPVVRPRQTNALSQAIFELLDRVVALEGGNEMSADEKDEWLQDKLI